MDHEIAKAKRRWEETRHIPHLRRYIATSSRSGELIEISAYCVYVEYLLKERKIRPTKEIPLVEIDLDGCFNFRSIFSRLEKKPDSAITKQYNPELSVTFIRGIDDSLSISIYLHYSTSKYSENSYSRFPEGYYEIEVFPEEGESVGPAIAFMLGKYYKYKGFLDLDSSPHFLLKSKLESINELNLNFEDGRPIVKGQKPIGKAVIALAKKHKIPLQWYALSNNPNIASFWLSFINQSFPLEL